MKTDSIDNYKGGWFIGAFEPSILRTKEFEVGLKIHKMGELIEPHRHNVVTEYNLLVAGIMLVNGKMIYPGTLFVFEPGEIVEAVVQTEEVRVICVKVPSIPSDREVVRV